MFSSSEAPIIGTILLVALGILGWGFYRARPFGKLGILAGAFIAPDLLVNWES